jgi:hypothetical protein
MADPKKVTLKLGKETLDVPEPTYEGITALESLGWEIESGSKPGKPRKAAKSTGSAPAFDEDKVRAEITAQLRGELEAEIRAELEKAAAEAKANEDGEQKPSENGDAGKTAAAKK